ncbi:MAG: biopolymer transporter ExbD [Planctomycetia bacterium]|nr:biopolymer transporter ExbD [Planctomycetia bacterium]
MVDIVFFLLIFFLVTSLNTQQASIESPVPESRRAASEGRAAAARTVVDFENDEDFIIARIDADNTVWVEDALAPSPAEVLSKLRSSMRGAGAKGSPSRLLVLAHGDAHHGMAVMVLDAAQEAGLADVRLAVRDEE